MPPTYRHRDEDGVVTDISDYFRLYTLDVTMNAEEASVATSKVVADDPNGDLLVGGHRLFLVDESTATGSNTLIYAGYTADREVHRGDYHRVSTGRVWDISLVDINTVFNRRILRGADCNRPAETDVARMQWIESTNEAELIDDTLYLSTANPVQMDAANYKDQYVEDVVRDCMEASGKTAFVWWRGDTGEYSLFYDHASSDAYRSPLRLSNDLDDIDEVLTFAISTDTRLRRDPSRVYSGVLLPYDGGRVYEQDDATATTFAMGGRDVAMPSYNVKSENKARARAIRYLGDLSSEEDVITTSVVLPAAKVNFLMQGMGVLIKGTHLPGYEAFNWGRVLNRTVKELSEEYYQLDLEIVMTGPSVSDGGSEEVPPTPPSYLVGTMHADILDTTSRGGTSLAQYGETVELYDGCTYLFDMTVVHATTAAVEGSNVIVTLYNAVSAPKFNFGCAGNNNLVNHMTWEGVAGVQANDDPETNWCGIQYTAWAGRNAVGSTLACSVYYVSGPDPRF